MVLDYVKPNDYKGFIIEYFNEWDGHLKFMQGKRTKLAENPVEPLTSEYLNEKAETTGNIIRIMGHMEVIRCEYNRVVYLTLNESHLITLPEILKDAFYKWSMKKLNELLTLH